MVRCASLRSCCVVTRYAVTPWRRAQHLEDTERSCRVITRFTRKYLEEIRVIPNVVRDPLCHFVAEIGHAHSLRFGVTAN